MSQRVKFFSAISVAVVISSVSAHAATIGTTINFEQGVVSTNSNGSVVWDGYLVSPTNINNGQCEAGSCTLESGNGPLPDITRNSDSLLFDFNRFWFSIQGIGGNDDDDINSFYVEGFDENGNSVKKLTFTQGDSLGTFTDYSIAYKLGGGGTSPNGNPAAVALCTGSVICKSAGYAVTLGDAFDNLSKVSFLATSTANTRLDGFELERDDPSIVSTVPIPAAGWLLLASIGGLGALRRRKSVS